MTEQLDTIRRTCPDWDVRTADDTWCASRKVACTEAQRALGAVDEISRPTAVELLMELHTQERLTRYTAPTLP
jgi:hypothetical protein